MVMRMIFHDADDTDDANNDDAHNEDYDYKADANNCSHQANHSYQAINYNAGVDDDGTFNAEAGRKRVIQH